MGWEIRLDLNTFQGTDGLYQLRAASVGLRTQFYNQGCDSLYQLVPLMQQCRRAKRDIVTIYYFCNWKVYHIE